MGNDHLLVDWIRCDKILPSIHCLSLVTYIKNLYWELYEVLFGSMLNPWG